MNISEGTPLLNISSSTSATPTTTSNKSVAAARESEMTQPEKLSGKEGTQKVLEKLNQNGSGTATFIVDAKDYLRSRGSDDLYVVSRGNETYALFKQGPIVIDKKIDKDTNLDSLKKDLQSQASQIKSSGNFGSPPIPASAQKRIDDAINAAQGKTAQVPGGQGAQALAKIAGETTKKSRGFFGFLFGKKAEDKALSEEHKAGIGIAALKNLKTATDIGKLSEEIEQLKQDSLEGKKSSYKNLQKVADEINKKIPDLIKIINKQGKAEVEIEGHKFEIIKTKGSDKLYVRFGGVGHLGKGMVKQAEYGFEINLLSGDFTSIAIAQGIKKDKTTEKELKAEYKRGREIKKIVGDGIFVLREVAKLGKGKKGYISQFHVGNYKINFEGVGEKSQILPYEKRLENGAKLISALNKMHDKRMIHGDVKGENIGIEVNGDAGLYDFGESLTEKEHAELQKSLPQMQKSFEKIQKQIESLPPGQEQDELILNKDKLDKNIKAAETTFEDLKKTDLINLAAAIAGSFTTKEKDDPEKLKQINDMLRDSGREVKKIKQGNEYQFMISPIKKT